MIPSAGAKKYAQSEKTGRLGSRKKCSSEIHLSGCLRWYSTSVSTHSFKGFAIVVTPPARDKSLGPRAATSFVGVGAGDRIVRHAGPPVGAATHSSPRAGHRIGNAARGGTAAVGRPAAASATPSTPRSV